MTYAMSMSKVYMIYDLKVYMIYMMLQTLLLTEQI